jgi:polyisoprenoid-binding protein YceI
MENPVIKQTVLAAVLGLAVCAPAFSADTYAVDTRHTYPMYEVSHFGWSTQRGRFNEASGKIVLDRAAKTGSVAISIKTASVDTGIAKWDEHMVSEDFFNAAKFPTIDFKASKIVFDGDKPASVPGELTLLGVTKPVTLTVTAFGCGTHPVNKKEVCGADAHATIKRSEFGMTKYLPGISDEVKLVLNVEAFKE